MKLDMHCHVKEGSIDSKVELDAYITKLKSHGFGGMLITDHDTYKGYRYWKNQMKGRFHEDFVVLKGIEYDTLDAGHILCIMPEGVRLRLLEIRGLPVSVLIDLVHKYGGILGPAHPFGSKFMSYANTKQFRKNPELTRRFDFIETFNACESAESNDRAFDLALRYEKPGFGGSDAHKIECVAMAYTELPGRIASESELIALVTNKETLAAGGNFYTKTTKDKIGKVNDLLVYSFWVYNRMGELIKRHKRNQKVALEHPAYAYEMHHVR